MRVAENELVIFYSGLSIHPVKPLIGIELEILRTKQDQVLDVDQLQVDFERLVESDRKTNPHRVATVASWMVVWGEKSGAFDLANYGFDIFNDIVDQHPEWRSIIDNERRKVALQSKRKQLFEILGPLARLFSPVTGFSSRWTHLYRNLTFRYES